MGALANRAKPVMQGFTDVAGRFIRAGSGSRADCLGGLCQGRAQVGGSCFVFSEANAMTRAAAF